MARGRAAVFIVMLLVLSALVGAGTLLTITPSCGFVYTILSQQEVQFEVVLDDSCLPQYGTGPYDFEWNFGDQSVGFNEHTDLPVISHTYAAAGSYLVTLTVHGSTIPREFTAIVDLVQTPVPLEVDLVLGASYLTVSYSVIATGGTGSYFYEVTFGLGLAETPVTAPSGTHTYTAAGTYHVSATVHDDKGQSTTDSEDITVIARPPPGEEEEFIVDFHVTTVGLKATFVASAQGGAGGPYAYLWQFGEANQQIGSESPTAQYTYAASGTYTVILTVTDSQGDSTSISKDVSPKTGKVFDDDPPLPADAGIFALVGAGLAVGFGLVVRRIPKVLRIVLVLAGLATILWIGIGWLSATGAL